jgi:hypothetical protein
MEDAINSDQAVIGTLNILTHPSKVLVDTVENTSFISRKCIDAYVISSHALEHPMTIVST